MDEKLSLPVILGTGRPENNSQKAARFVESELQTDEQVDTQLIDVSALGWSRTEPPWQDESTQPPYHDVIENADGLVIVVPEYNHGYPGELKLFLDSMFDEYNRKPVALCGVSGGRLGGARVVEHIKPVLIELGLVPLGRAVYFSNVNDLFDDHGALVDDSMRRHVEKLKEDLVWFAKTLKHGRENF